MISNLIILIVLLIFGYAALYISGRKYLEHFEVNSNMPNIDYMPEMPYLTKPIDNVDDYELSLVFQNTGSKETSKKQISDAMTRYPLDWSVQGPDSQYFQENQEKYEKTAQPMAPIDTVSDPSMEEEEMKILKTYQPESSKDLLEYSVDDVKKLIERVYVRKGLIPVIEKSKQGQNVWEITEVKEKNPTIVWEEQAKEQTERKTKTQRGEEVIEVPYTTSDIAAGLDPFFQPRNSMRDNKYNQFTPGLERMFAPTYPVKEWF